MDGGDFEVSGYALNLVLVTLLYISAVFFSYRRLILRLSPSARLLATGMMASQVFVVGISSVFRPSSGYEEWLWHLDREFNIPGTLASTQLAVVAGAALVTAWLAKAMPAWQRLFLVGLSVVFLFWANDEYFQIHEFNRYWHIHYAVLGAIIVWGTMLVALRSPRRTRIWHVYFLAGLALTATGAIIVERMPTRIPSHICNDLGFLKLDPCLLTYRLEESLELLGIWLALVAMLGLLSNAVPTPAPRLRLVHYLLPGVWLCFLLVHAVFPRIELRLLAQPASAEFESGIHVHGYRIETSTGATRVQLYLSARKPDYFGLGYSIHLVDQVSGKSVASNDKWAEHHHSIWVLGPNYVQVYRSSMDVIYPPQTPTNRALWVVLTLWREVGDEFVAQKIISSDHQLLNDTQVVLSEWVLPGESTASQTIPLAVFDNGFALDAFDLPERAQAGESMTIEFNWRSDDDGAEDYVQFLHFGHEESGSWWVNDQLPLGPRLPTRLWYDKAS